jgi:hypothetical protein
MTAAEHVQPQWLQNFRARVRVDAMTGAGDELSDAGSVWSESMDHGVCAIGGA